MYMYLGMVIMKGYLDRPRVTKEQEIEIYMDKIDLKRCAFRLYPRY